MSLTFAFLLGKFNRKFASNVHIVGSNLLTHVVIYFSLYKAFLTWLQRSFFFFNSNLKACEA